MVMTWDIAIPELTQEELRRAYVYLPDAYFLSPTERFPVLYMFDGHNVFFDTHATYGKSWGMKDYMDHQDLPLIIAAVECNHHPDHGRLSEYSPYDFSNGRFGMIKGRGQITMDWFVHTFKPLIDSRFRTLPDREHTYIAGSSMGGLMSVYALLAYNDYFSKAAALSPSLWFSFDRIMQLIRQSKVSPKTALYMDYGELELGRRKRERLASYSQVSSALLDQGVLLTSRIIPGGTHSESSWEKQLPFFMNLLIYPFA